MNAVSSPSSSTLHSFHGQWRRRRKPSPSLQLRDVSPRQPLPLQISSSLFRRRRNNRYRNPGPSPSEHNFEVSIDVEDIPARASAALTRFFHSSEAKFHRFLSSGTEAYDDLRTSVSFDRGNRIVFSCRRSSLLFVANLLVWGFVGVFAARALVWLAARLGFPSGWGFSDRSVIRRDRSLAGREVVVGRRSLGREAKKKGFSFSTSPLSLERRAEMKVPDTVRRKSVARQEKLPKWWPDSISSPVVSVGKQEYQREADALVRAIMDNRMSGMDYKDDDIIQLRQICKISGSKVSFDTTYSRDSFYRASLDFVLNICSRVARPTANITIDGEEARQFITGLAENIGLENVRAARLVRAAVAARTRSFILQSWALEVQGKQSEALEELSKICLIHRIFPPEEYSPEMEMVASGLKKNLGVEQREHLFNLFRGVCGAETQRSAAEALGLMNFTESERSGDMQDVR